MLAPFHSPFFVVRAARKFGAAFWFCLLAAGVALPLAAPGALGQNVTAVGSISDPTAEVGQPVEYSIEVTGVIQGAKAPQTPQVEGLKITLTGQHQSRQISGDSNGIRMVNIISFVYNVEAQHPGKYVIPGQEIQTGAGVAKVLPVAFTVSNGGAGGGGRNDPSISRFVELAISKKSAYVGESVPVEVRAYFGINIRPEIDPNPILTGEGFTVQKFTQPQVDIQLVEDNQFRVVTFKSVVAGAKIGSLTIGPVTMSPILHLPRPRSRRQSQFSNPFDDDPFFNDPTGLFNSTITKQEELRSDPVKLEIKPLPAGAPADFSGAIGQFKLQAEAEPRRVQAGDPITVRLHLSGSGNFERANAPTLTDDQNLRAYPPSAKFKADEDLGLSGVKTFEQVVVAQNSRNSLPGYRFSYFDPVAVRYVSLETPPIPVHVEGSVTPPPTPTAAVAAAPSPTPSATPKPKTAPQDILYIRTDREQPVGAEAFLPLYRQRTFWWMQAVPLVLLIGLGIGIRQRARARDAVARRIAEAQRQQAQLVKALQSERTGRRDFYTAAARLAQLRAASDTGRSDTRLSASEVCAAKHLDPQTAASVEEIFHRHDELVYSGARAAQEPVPLHERKGVLATLETIEKN